MKDHPFKDPSVYAGILVTVMAGMILIYIASLAVDFVLRNIWWFVAIFFVVVGILLYNVGTSTRRL
jgi:heme/copper-type cytochrome/quinol oxidase subunit 1